MPSPPPHHLHSISSPIMSLTPCSSLGHLAFPQPMASLEAVCFSFLLLISPSTLLSPRVVSCCHPASLSSLCLCQCLFLPLPAPISTPPPSSPPLCHASLLSPSLVHLVIPFITSVSLSGICPRASSSSEMLSCRWEPCSMQVLFLAKE